VVPLRLGDRRQRVEEVDGGDKALRGEPSRDGEAVGAEAPGRDDGEERGDVGGGDAGGVGAAAYGVGLGVVVGVGVGALGCGRGGLAEPGGAAALLMQQTRCQLSPAADKREMI